MLSGRNPPNGQILAPPTHAFGRKVLDLADQLATYSEVPDNLTCTYLSPPHRAVASQLQAWMQHAGLDTTIDAVGNVVGKFQSPEPAAKTVIVGSHYDTVRNAGKYDGRLGILTALVVIEHVVRCGRHLPFHVEIIGFAEEEGLRFATAYLGSSAVVGKFDLRSLENRDASGVSVADVIRASGGDPAQIPGLARRAEDLLGYIEVHIEQGPVLLENGLPLGIVTAVAGTARYAVAITGTAGHAGTVPMPDRHDAVAAAAELVLFLEQRCKQVPGVVGTVGQFNAPDGVTNVIPARCDISLDIRADEVEKHNATIADVFARAKEIEQRRGVTIEITELQRVPVVPCSPALQKLIAESIAKMGIAPYYLPSGAGHDAVMFNGVTELGMLFVRCGNGGVSHSPLETVTEDDADLAARVLLEVMLNIHDAR